LSSPLHEPADSRLTERRSYKMHHEHRRVWGGNGVDLIERKHPSLSQPNWIRFQASDHPHLPTEAARGVRAAFAFFQHPHCTYRPATKGTPSQPQYPSCSLSPAPDRIAIVQLIEDLRDHSVTRRVNTRVSSAPPGRTNSSSFPPRRLSIPARYARGFNKRRAPSFVATLGVAAI